MSWFVDRLSFSCRFYLLLSAFFVFMRWVRVLLETLDISVSQSCAWTWIAMAIVCACGGSDLYVILSCGFSLKDIG